MYKLKKNGKVFTSKSVGTGPSSCEKRIYRPAVSQRLRNTGLWATLTLRGSASSGYHAKFHEGHGLIQRSRSLALYMWINLSF